MTTPSHAVGTFLIAKATGAPLPLCLWLGFNSMTPDIVGYLEKLVKDDPHAWGWYNYCHHFHWWQLLFPEWLLHIGLDYPLHTDQGWKPITYYFEVFSWILYLIIFLSVK